MSEPRKVVVLFDSSQALLPGIVQYAREQPLWHLDYLRTENNLAKLKTEVVHGAIANITDEEHVQIVKKLRIPVVDVSCERLIPTLPWVNVDNAAVGRLAAEHLLERGFKHFGYCGQDIHKYSQQRRDQFVRCIRDAGFHCSVFPSSQPPKNVPAGNELFTKWLTSLPQPAGVMAVHSYWGHLILENCQRCGIAIPDSIAIISVYAGDSSLLAIRDMPLSSVNVDVQRIGYEAAALLERMMSGIKVKPDGHLIAPSSVVTRQSTDVLAIDDPQVKAALRYVLDHACEGINVKDVLKALPQSRRSLEYRFKKLVGRSLHDEILRVQLNQAKILLTGSDLSLELISERTGFAYVGYFSHVFAKKVGLSPGRYRIHSRSQSDIK